MNVPVTSPVSRPVKPEQYSIHEPVLQSDYVLVVQAEQKIVFVRIRFNGNILLISVSDPLHFNADPDSVPGSASGKTDPDLGPVTDPDPDPT